MALVRFSGSLFLSRSRFYKILRLVRLLPMESCRKGRRRGISSVLPFSKIRRNLQRQLRGSYVIIPHSGCTNASPKMLHRCFAAQMHRKALNSNLTSPLRCPPATLAMAASRGGSTRAPALQHPTCCSANCSAKCFEIMFTI